MGGGWGSGWLESWTCCCVVTPAAHSVWLGWSFGFTAIGGFVPFYAFVAVCRGGQGACGPWGPHPETLKASALWTDADVAAAPSHQRRLLGQSVGEGRLGQAGAPAQLAVAEAGGGGGGARPALFQGEGPWPQDGRPPPAPHLQAVTTQDDALQLPQHLLTHRLLHAHVHAHAHQDTHTGREVDRWEERGRESPAEVRWVV